MPSMMFFAPDFEALEVLGQRLRFLGVEPLEGTLEVHPDHVKSVIQRALPDMVVVTPTQGKMTTTFQELKKICQVLQIRMVFLATDTDVRQIPIDMLKLAQIVFLEGHPNVVARQLLEVMNG